MDYKPPANLLERVEAERFAQQSCKLSPTGGRLAATGGRSPYVSMDLVNWICI